MADAAADLKDGSRGISMMPLKEKLLGKVWRTLAEFLNVTFHELIFGFD